MATIKELRLRIKSLKNTSKITSAMKMVSAAKLKKAQNAYSRTKPYYEKMLDLLERISGAMEDFDHPLMEAREVKHTAYYVLTSDRGLCGGFNNNLLKFFARQYEKGKSIECHGIGRRAKEFIVRNSLPIGKAESTNMPSLSNANTLGAQIISDYTSGKVDKVFVVFNKFNSVLSQTPTLVQVLPFPKQDKKKNNAAANYIVEPNIAEVFSDLLPQIVTIQLFRSLLENAVGEHSARMASMDSATKNTKDMISRLTLIMNRARQASITKELIEIVSGAEALNG